MSFTKAQVEAAIEQVRFTKGGGRKMMISMQDFQPTTNWTLNPDGSVRNKVRLMEQITQSKYRMEVIMLAGIELPERYETVSNLSILNR